jgi:hypothetical protein
MIVLSYRFADFLGTTVNGQQTTEGCRTTRCLVDSLSCSLAKQKSRGLVVSEKLTADQYIGILFLPVPWLGIDRKGYNLQHIILP